jgi:hypothetical protein
MLSLSFETVWVYEAGAPGITIPVELSVGALRATPDAKLDTGSTFCVFQREHGEALGFNIETGLRELISTPMGSFTAFGHSVTLSVLGFQLDVTVYFAAHHGFTRNVLGRVGFMQQLNLGAVDYEGKLYIGKYGNNVS